MKTFFTLNQDNYDNSIINDDSINENPSNNEFLYSDLIYDLFEEIKNNKHLGNINISNNSSLFKVIKVEKHRNTRQNRFSGKKRNRALDKDNIICTIQIHFFNFLVNFANDAIKTEFKDKEQANLVFKNIQHKFKKQTSSKYIRKLTLKPISSILQLDVSKKYRKLPLDKDYNKNIYDKLIASSGWLEKLFEMKIVDAFKLYYNNCQHLDSIYFEGKIINFSEKTKSFYSLYNEAETEEKKSKLKSIAENDYLKLRNQSIFKVE